MATTNPVTDITGSSSRALSSLLVMVAAMPAEQLAVVLEKLSASFAAESLLVATPDVIPAGVVPGVRMIPSQATKASWILTAEDFANAWELAEKNDARGILVLGPEAGSLNASALLALASPVLAGSADLVMPHYNLVPHAGLVNSAILYPLSRALFASRARFPLAVDLGLSKRMAERMANAAQRPISLRQDGSPLWPVNEAAVAGLNTLEVDAGQRALPQPGESGLNTILPLVTGSLFADIDAKATFWQRARTLPAARTSIPPSIAMDAMVDIAPMLEGFRLAHTNLGDLWSLVLPPNSLLGLKRLSATEASAFRMPESLWARIVYDFLLAYRLRTLNRGHLLGALIPLYLAWVASHINIIASGTDAERHIEEVAKAFEEDKPYLVARWRWPDRFNP